MHSAVGRAAVEAAATRLALAEGVWLVNRVADTAWPESCYVEIVVGAATMEWSADEVAKALGGLVR